MRNKFNEKLCDIMKQDDTQMGEFPYKVIEVLHLDGSKLLIKNSNIVKVEVEGLPCVVIKGMHLSPNIFVEYDLKAINTTPMKGKKTKFVLAKEPKTAPTKTKPAKKKAVKKVVKKKPVKKVAKKKVAKKVLKKAPTKKKVVAKKKTTKKGLLKS